MYLCFLKIIFTSICLVLEFLVLTAIWIVKSLASHIARHMLSHSHLVLSLEIMVSDNSHVASQEFKRQATTVLYFPPANVNRGQSKRFSYAALLICNQTDWKNSTGSMILHTFNSQHLES